jgi:hypothetical protein
MSFEVVGFVIKCSTTGKELTPKTPLLGKERTEAQAGDAVGTALFKAYAARKRGRAKAFYLACVFA